VAAGGYGAIELLLGIRGTELTNIGRKRFAEVATNLTVGLGYVAGRL